MKAFLISALLVILVLGYFFVGVETPEKTRVPDMPVASGTLQRSLVPEQKPASDKLLPSAPVSADPFHDRYRALSNNSNYPTLDARLHALRELYPYREFSPGDVLDQLAQTTAWEASAAIPDGLPITNAQRNDGRAFIELNPERLQILLPGDELDLPLEQLGMQLQMQVDSREPLANGGFTLHGHILGSAEPLRVTITQGPGLSLAGIDTPQGHVVLQANDTQGWIASSETLFKQDPHTTDVLLPTDE